MFNRYVKLPEGIQSLIPGDLSRMCIQAAQYLSEQSPSPRQQACKHPESGTRKIPFWKSASKFTQKDPKG